MLDLAGGAPNNRTRKTRIARLTARDAGTARGGRDATDTTNGHGVRESSGDWG